MNKDGDKILIAKGGLGGDPSNRFIGQKGQVNLIFFYFRGL